MQRALHPLAADIHEAFEPGLALFVAGSFVGCGVTTEAKHVLVHDDVDVLGEALDEFPGLGERGATLEGEVIADAGKGEELAQRPADPEVLFDARRIETHCPVYFKVGVELVGGAKL